MSNKYEIDPNDPALKAVDTKRNTDLTNIDTSYDNMITESDKAFDDQITGIEQLQDTLEKNQNEATDFAIEKINQQKDQAHKDYLKEQTAAYGDYKRQVNPYGVNAERIAAMGLQDSGYSESSKVRMYSDYQNRVAVARQTYKQVELNYNNAITEAKLQNNAALAKIALETYEKISALIIQKLSAKQGLLSEKANKELQIKSMYNTEWQNVYDNLLKEKELEERARQHDETLAFQKQQHEDSQKAASAPIVKTYTRSGGSGSNKTLSSSKSIQSGRKSKWGDNTAINKAVLAAKADKLSSYDEAMAFLKNNGISASGLRLLKSFEWYQAKRRGEEGSELRYSNYNEYLQAICKWYIQQM